MTRAIVTYNIHWGGLADVRKGPEKITVEHDVAATSSIDSLNRNIRTSNILGGFVVRTLQGSGSQTYDHGTLGK